MRCPQLGWKRSVLAWQLPARLLVATALVAIATPVSAGFSSYLRAGVTDLSVPETLQTELQNQTNGSASHSFDTRTDEYGLPYSAEASASFDLGSGEARFFLSATGNQATAAAAFNFFDEITPYWNDVSKTGIIPVTVSWQVDGSYQITGSSLKNLGLFAWFYYGVDTQTLTPHSTNQYNLTDGVETLEQVFNFDPGVNDYIRLGEAIGGWLDPYNSQTATADFRNTSSIRIQLPAGAAFSSTSGVLLKPVEAPAPIPLPLLGAGLAGIAVIRSRRKTRRAQRL